MLRTTTIAKELATIERKMQETDNATLKEALKKKQARLKAELKDPKQSATQLAKTLLAQREAVKQLSKVEFNDLIRRLSKKPEYSFLKTMSKSTVKNDLEVTAKPVGWRFKGRGNYDKPTKAEIAKGKKSGTVYREVRPIRSDVSQVVKLAEGGGVDEKIKSNVVDILSELHSFSNKIKFTTDNVNGVWNIIYDDPEQITKNCLDKLRSNKFWNTGFAPSIGVFNKIRVNIHFEKSVQSMLNIQDFDKKDWLQKIYADGGSMYAKGGGVDSIEPTGWKQNDAVEYGKKLIDAGVKYSVVRSKIEEHYAGLRGEIQDVMNKVLDYKDSKMSDGGSMYAEGGGVDKSDLEYSLRMILDEKGLNPIAVKSVKKSGKTFIIVVSSYITPSDLVTELNSLLKTSFEIIDGSMTKSVTGNKIFKIKESKMSDGGSMYAEGGSIEQESVEMVKSQTKEVKHHAIELSNALKSKKNIEPWVIAKMERASTDLSDITHYLEGQEQKMEQGGQIGSTITFRNFQGDIREGQIIDVLGNRGYEVRSGFGTALVKPDEIVSFGSKMAKGGNIEVGDTIRLKTDLPYMASLSSLMGKDLEVVDVKEVYFASGPKKFYHVVVDGDKHEVNEDFVEHGKKMMHGGSIEVGDKVKATKEYGGKSGTVIDKRGSFVVVEDSKGNTESYHESDLIKKMAKGGCMYAEGGNIEIGDSVSYTRKFTGVKTKGSVIEIDEDEKYVKVRNSVGNIDYIPASEIKKMSDGGSMYAGGGSTDEIIDELSKWRFKTEEEYKEFYKKSIDKYGYNPPSSLHLTWGKKLIDFIDPKDYKKIYNKLRLYTIPDLRLDIDGSGIKTRVTSEDIIKDNKMAKGGGIKTPWDKLNIIAEEEYGEFGFATLDEDDIAKHIDIKKANKIAEEEYGEFGFATLEEEDMKEVINNNPSLLKPKMAKGGQLTAAQQKKFDQVMHEWGQGKLHSGKNGPIVKDQDQAIAIAYAEARGMKKMAKGGSMYAGGGNIERGAKKRLAEFFRVPLRNLDKFKFDGNDDVKELTKALNSTSEQGTKMYYEMAIKLSKEDEGDYGKYATGGSMYAGGGEIRKMYSGDAVLYEDKTWYITEKNGKLGITNFQSGAWGSDYPFIELSKIDMSNITDMMGRNIEIVDSKMSKGGATDGGVSKIRFDIYGYVNTSDRVQTGDEILMATSYENAEKEAEKFLKKNNYKLVELYRKNDFVGSIKPNSKFIYSSKYKKEDFAKGGYLEGREEFEGFKYQIYYSPTKGMYSVSDNEGIFKGDNNYFKKYDQAKEHAEISISSMLSDKDEMAKGGGVGKYKIAYAGKGFYGITNGGEIIGEYSKEEAQKEANKRNSKMATGSSMGWKHKMK